MKRSPFTHEPPVTRPAPLLKPSLQTPPRPGNATQDSVPAEASETALDTTANVLHMQRIAGNQHVLRMMHQTGAPVQRLLTADQLTLQAGAPKKDKGFTNPFTKKKVVLKKMSTGYRKVIDALTSYHNLLSNSGKITALDKVSSAGKLKNALQVVVDSSNEYLENHNSDKESETDRNDAVRLVISQAEGEKKIIDHIVKASTYNGRTWAEVVPILTPILDLEREVEDGSIQESQFHGTNSALLGKFSGEMLSGKELENRKITTSSGEGDFYSTGGGAKDFISSGQGIPGLGTTLAYARANAELVEYNPALYTDNDLQNDIAKLKRIVANWKEELNQVSKDELMKARREKLQFQSLLKRLTAEFELREKLPKTHPRRQGQNYSESMYPLLFEFTSDNLTIINPRPERDLNTDSREGFERALGGERMIKTPSIDFRIPGRLKRVYCPFEKVGEVKSRLAEILKHSQFQVIPFEVLNDFLPEASKYTMTATLSEMKNNYSNQRSMVLYAYDQGMTNNQPVTSQTLDVRAQELGIIKAIAKGARNANEIHLTMSTVLVTTIEERLQGLLEKFQTQNIEDIPARAREAGLLSDQI